MKVSKNIWLLPFLFIFVHIGYIGCCKCITDLKGKPYRQITYIKATEYGFSQYYSRDTVFIKDSLYTNLNIAYELIAQQNSNPFRAFVNPTMALSCNCINVKDSGYKYRVDSLGVFSNNEFANIPAGKNLISLFKGAYYSNYTGSAYKNLNVPQLLDTLNYYRDYNTISLQLKYSNPLVTNHKFKYVVFTQGRAIEANNSKLLIWE